MQGQSKQRHHYDTNIITVPLIVESIIISLTVSFEERDKELISSTLFAPPRSAPPSASNFCLQFARRERLAHCSFRAKTYGGISNDSGGLQLTPFLTLPPAPTTPTSAAGGRPQPTVTLLLDVSVSIQAIIQIRATNAKCLLRLPIRPLKLRPISSLSICWNTIFWWNSQYSSFTPSSQRCRPRLYYY